MAEVPSLREQAIAWVKKRRDVEVAIAASYGSNALYRHYVSWHMGEAGAYQFVLDALEDRSDGTPSE